MKLTWRQLLNELQAIAKSPNACTLDDTATIYNAGWVEYFAVERMQPAENDGVLDPGALVLVINDDEVDEGISAVTGKG